MRQITIGCFALALLLWNPSLSKGESNMIEEGKTVTFHYTLTVEGEVADSSEGKDPISYVHGQNMIVPGLEKEMVGLKAGDERKINVVSSDAYGPVNPQMVIEVPKESLKAEQEPQPGMVLQMQTKEGRPLNGIVKEVKDATMILDFNHPLAGKDLEFAIEIVQIQ